MSYAETNSSLNPSGVPTQNRNDGVAAATSMPLSANATWSTGWLDLSGYKQIYVTLLSDQTGTVMLSFSGDASSVLLANSRPYTAVNTFFRNSFPINTKYFKLDYTNGTNPQSKFWAQVFLSNTAMGHSNFDLNQRLSVTNLADTSRAVIEVPDSTGTSFDMVQRTGSSLNVHLDDNTSVAVNNLPATQPVSGSVSVSNFPASQPVTGTITAVPAQNVTIYKSGNFYTTGIATSTTYKVLGGYEFFSPNARVYLWLYNKATAPNTASDNPVDYVTIPQATVILAEAVDLGGFSAGIAFALSTNPPTGASAPYGYAAPSSSQYVQMTLRGRAS